MMKEITFTMFEHESLKVLQRIEQWVAIIAKAQLGPILQAELADPRMAQLYRLTGTSTQREVKAALKMSATTISDAWNRWEQLGLLVREGKEFRKVIDITPAR
jgi:DNA-binding MarR family transcriptional regulator